MLHDGGEDFVDGAGGIEELGAEFVGDFGVSGVNFLLESVGFHFEGFFDFAASFLASETNCVGNGKNKAVVGVNIFLGEQIFC